MKFLGWLDWAWGKLLWALMAFAALYIGFIMVAIIYQTVFRTAGWDYSPLGFVLIEYGFVYALFLGSPWLIRQRGHIYIEILTAMLSPRARTVLSRLIAFACAITCFIWVWYSWQLLVEQYDDPMAYDELRAQFDIRSWLGTVAFPFGFALMGLEFVRFMFTHETMHQGVAGVASERAELEETRARLAGQD
ncbi:MAG: TRAP transporter small permease [Pseudomonadota bacterium]